MFLYSFQCASLHGNTVHTDNMNVHSAQFKVNSRKIYKYKYRHTQRYYTIQDKNSGMLGIWHYQTRQCSSNTLRLVFRRSLAQTLAGFSSAPSSKCWISTSIRAWLLPSKYILSYYSSENYADWATTASLQILSNVLFTSHPTGQYYSICDTVNVKRNKPQKKKMGRRVWINNCAPAHLLTTQNQTKGI